ncbi:hypothetical protein [Kitasatospora cinereorecta]|uniref:Transglycosylase SLT domain-containing protein n=1 Tax=Kitasatospora cinereorecta TaxID=285560 RepID=A0ABW0VCZ5_9ACTN
MAGNSFGIRFDELERIQQEWKSLNERMADMSRQTAGIKGTVAKAAATDLMAGELAGVVGFVAVTEQVAASVKDILSKLEKLQETKEKLTKELAEDATKIKAVIKAYEDAERKTNEEMRKHDKDHGKPKSPKSPPTRTDGGGGKHEGGGGGHHPMPEHPKQTGDHGDGGGHGGNDPTPHPSSEGVIKKGDVTFGGKGSYKSGPDACRDYIAKALDAMGITDPKAREAWTRGMLTIAERESSYNSPDWQVNKGPGDVNVNGPIQSDGAPLNCSRGGWQTTPETFAANHVKGTSTDIYDPVANCAASMEYVMKRYHVSPDGHDLAAKVQQADPGRKAHWY